MTFDRFTVLSIVAVVVSVILHEISHGVVALYFGDDTAKRAGRLTLNPVPHIDPLGSIILPVLGALTRAPIIGWAKPVPVNPTRLRNRRRDMLYVSLVGPATNFSLMIISAIALRALLAGKSYASFDDLPTLTMLLFAFATVNLLLGVFNLLPIPPLDGASMLERALPERYLPTWYQFRQYGMLVLFVLVFWTGFLASITDPFYRQLFRFIRG